MLFWERFYNLCLKMNKKPNTVCNELGFSSATATHWKNGTMPKGDALLSLSNYFDCTTDYLLGREETKKTAVLSVENSNISKLIGFYNQLTEDAQKEMLSYAEYMTTKPDNLRNSDESKRAV